MTWHIDVQETHLDDNMPIETIDRHIRRLRVESQVPRQIVLQGVHVTLGLLDLSLLLGATGLGDQVDGKLVGGGATNKIGQVGGLEVCGRARRRSILLESLLAFQLDQEGSALLCRDVGAGGETLEGARSMF